MVAKFEEAVRDYTHSKYAVAYSSCTTALHIALVIHGIGRGDEVLCPSYSFIASANSIRHAGAEPVFIDIDPDTLNITPQTVEAGIKRAGKKLKGIMLVHQIGIPADIDGINAVAKKHGLVVIEDAACALGSTYKGQQIGSSQNIAALSFHPRKVITTGEGGMLLTPSQEHAEVARMYREHGASISPLVRHSAQPTVYESYAVTGYNYRMTDMQGAVGVKQMEILDELIDRRSRIGKIYDEAFKALDEISIIKLPEYVSKWNYQSYPIRLREGGAARRGIPQAHLEPPYNQELELPITANVSEHSLFLPIFAQMTDAEIQHVAESVKESVRSKVLI
jgi:perosamine synthetase